MPSTKNLQDAINFAGAFINYQPLTIGGVDPAVQIANMILQTILGPPFCWRWNRGAASFVCAQVSGSFAQDYTVALSDYGFIEKAWLVADDSAKTVKELEIKTVLSATDEVDRPMFISDIGDDDAGNITFRLMPAPDKAYTVKVLYQKKPPLMNCLASRWSPIPDELSYIYNYGFLSMAAMMAGDQRFPIFNQSFAAHLLGAQDGLDDMARSIFLGNWLEVTKQVERAQIKPGQAIAGRQR